MFLFWLLRGIPFFFFFFGFLLLHFSSTENGASFHETDPYIRTTLYSHLRTLVILFKSHLVSRNVYIYEAGIKKRKEEKRKKQNKRKE